MTHDDAAPVARPRRPRRSRWTLIVAALAVVAVLLPVGWLLARPAPQEGLTLAEALAGPSEPAAPSAAVPSPGQDPSEPVTTPAPEPSPAFGPVTVRDASPASLPAATGPAPARLVVPDLGVDVAVDAVGVQDDGAMVIPGRVDRVGWYRYGPSAGAARGNAVIAGHVDARGQAQKGVMYPVGQAPVGTRVTVVDAAGTPHEYEVVGRETITKSVLPVADIFARDGEHRLLLITCGGPFQPELGSYRDNVVVTAIPVGG